jgi:hypothetical protein
MSGMTPPTMISATNSIACLSVSRSLSSAR